MRPIALLLILACPLPALAQDSAVFARFWTSSGSLPPEYAWDAEVTFLTDGTLTLKHCTGYETEGPACQVRTAKVDATALEAIRTAIVAADLVATPAREDQNPPVGGGATGGSVVMGGAEIGLPPWPIPADKKRVAKVLAAIHAAIPAQFDQFIDPA